MSVGDNIRIARIKKGINQKELAEMLNAQGIKIGNTTICNWENGTSKPDPDTIAILCNLLNVDANYILDFKKNDYLTSPILSEKEEVELLKNILKNKGILDNNDEMSQEDFDRLIEFAKVNKQFIMKDKKE